MIIKHAIESEDTEALALFELVSSVCLTTYSSAEEQAVHVEAAKLTFKVALDDLVCKAFKVGQKVCKANETDTEMYKL